MAVSTRSGLVPIRKVAIGTVAGLPIAGLIPPVLGLLGWSLPDPVIGLVGAALTALIAYVVKSGPGEAAPPPPPAHYAPVDPGD